MSRNRFRVHLVSETAFLMRSGEGTHTAFVDCLKLLKEDGDVETVVNEQGQGDVLHAHTYGLYYFWKGRSYRGRIVLTVHVIPDSIKGSLPVWRFLMPFARLYFRWVYSYAEVCIAVSPNVEKTIRELRAKTRIIQIPNPLNTEKFRPCPDLRERGRKVLGVEKDAFVVLGVGQLQKRKAVEDYLDVAAACPDLTFIWVGGRPFGVMTEGIARINKRISERSKNAFFPGVFDLDEMPAIYNAADLFLFPSYQENCPFAPLEAASSGLPVIYRDIPEYVALYKNPYLKARDISEFIALTRKMASDRAFYEKGKLISKNLISQFERREIRRRLIAIYRELLQ